MKRCLTVVVLLVVVGAAEGAHFSYYAGGLSAFCEVNAVDSTYYDGPYSDTNDSTSSASVEEYAWVSDAYSYAYNGIWSHAENDSICIQSQSVSDAVADNGLAYTEGWVLAGQKIPGPTGYTTLSSRMRGKR